MFSPGNRHWLGGEGNRNEQREKLRAMQTQRQRPVDGARVALQSCTKLGQDGQAYIFPYWSFIECGLLREGHWTRQFSVSEAIPEDAKSWRPSAPCTPRSWTASPWKRIMVSTAADYTFFCIFLKQIFVFIICFVICIRFNFIFPKYQPDHNSKNSSSKSRNHPHLVPLLVVRHTLVSGLFSCITIKSAPYPFKSWLLTHYYRSPPVLGFMYKKLGICVFLSQKQCAAYNPISFNNK